MAGGGRRCRRDLPSAPNSNENAIWWSTSSRWLVGQLSDLVKELCGIEGPEKQTDLPNNIIKGWEYYAEDEWKTASLFEINFVDFTSEKCEIFSLPTVCIITITF